MICELDYLSPDGVAHYLVGSYSRPELPPHRPAIDLTNGSVDCSCENFEMSKRPLAEREGAEPVFNAPRYLCRHLHMAIADCIKRGDIIIG